MNEELNKNDYKLLKDALDSNGGGIDYECYYESTIKRLLKKCLIQWKPNQLKSKTYTRLLTITITGKETLNSLIVNEDKKVNNE